MLVGLLIVSIYGVSASAANCPTTAVKINSVIGTGDNYNGSPTVMTEAAGGCSIASSWAAGLVRGAKSACPTTGVTANYTLSGGVTYTGSTSALILDTARSFPNSTFCGYSFDPKASLAKIVTLACPQADITFGSTLIATLTVPGGPIKMNGVYPNMSPLQWSPGMNFCPNFAAGSKKTMTLDPGVYQSNDTSLRCSYKNPLGGSGCSVAIQIDLASSKCKWLSSSPTGVHKYLCQN